MCSAISINFLWIFTTAVRFLFPSPVFATNSTPGTTACVRTTFSWSQCCFWPSVSKSRSSSKTSTQSFSLRSCTRKLQWNLSTTWLHSCLTLTSSSVGSASWKVTERQSTLSTKSQSSRITAPLRANFSRDPHWSSSCFQAPRKVRCELFLEQAGRRSRQKRQCRWWNKRQRRRGKKRKEQLNASPLLRAVMWKWMRPVLATFKIWGKDLKLLASIIYASLSSQRKGPEWARQ